MARMALNEVAAQNSSRNGNKAGEEFVGLNENGTPYNPYTHRFVKHPTTNRETLIHLLKGSLGTGILAMPQAFHNAGLVNGVIGTLLIGFLCTYCLDLLVKCQFKICVRKRVPILTYPDTMKYALQQGPPCLRCLAPISKPVVDGFLIIYQLGICCVYIVFMADSLKQVCKEFNDIPVEYYMMGLVLPLMLITLIPNLKLLAPFSQAANILTFAGLGIILYYIFQDFPSIDSVKMYGTIPGCALFIGTTLFALEAVGVVLSVENNMATPASFGGPTGVFSQSMLIITAMYLSMGFLGYVRYGEKVEASITLSLPEFDKLAQCTKVIFAIAIFVTYALQAYVPVQILWNNYIKKYFQIPDDDKWGRQYFLRTGIVIFTFLLAISVPYLGLFISFFGALCLSVLGVVYPALANICVNYPSKYGKFGIILIKDVILIIIGILAGFLGTYIATVDIISEMGKRYN